MAVSGGGKGVLLGQGESLSTFSKGLTHSPKHRTQEHFQGVGLTVSMTTPLSSLLFLSFHTALRIVQAPKLYFQALPTDTASSSNHVHVQAPTVQRTWWFRRDHQEPAPLRDRARHYQEGEAQGRAERHRPDGEVLRARTLEQLHVQEGHARTTRYGDVRRSDAQQRGGGVRGLRQAFQRQDPQPHLHRHADSRVHGGKAGADPERGVSQDEQLRRLTRAALRTGRVARRFGAGVGGASSRDGHGD